jgi:hypothetical protein
MIRRLFLVSLLFPLAVPLGAAAQDTANQDAPSMDTVIMLYWQCDWEALEALEEKSQSLYVPILQELQDEGKIGYAQMLFHAWGDEWNWIWYLRAPDVPSFLSEWPEWFSRLEEREPGALNWIFQRCHTHKDSFYVSIAATTIN